MREARTLRQVAGLALAAVVLLLAATGCDGAAAAGDDAGPAADARAHDVRDVDAARPDAGRDTLAGPGDAVDDAQAGPRDTVHDAQSGPDDAVHDVPIAPDDVVRDAGADRDTAVEPPDAGWDAGGAGDDVGSPPDPICFGSAVDDTLPERVVFRSKTTSFNRQWFVALRDGRIWVKPNTDEGLRAEDWRQLGSGLPDGLGNTRFDPPTEITEISADGTWLHAISSDGVFYRGTDFTGNVHASFTWSDAWGHPAATGPGITIEFPTTHGWSVSDSQRAGVDHYEDRLGTSHDVGMGVAHVYRAGGDGRSLHFNDWWLPADWSRQICLPDRGTFLVEGLSVSASTILVVGSLGELYTRIYDFDTAGENNTLEYSYLISEPTGNVRALPAEPWLRQPDIPDGLITSRVTIFQDGQGNAARTLRVEGVRGDRTGYWEKRIFDQEWSFQETGDRVCGPFLDAPGRPPRAPVSPEDFSLQGSLSVNRTFGGDVSVGIHIADFNMICSPARAELLVDGVPVTVGGVPLEFPLHHVHSLYLQTRPTWYWRDGDPAEIRAALLLPAEIEQVDDAAALDTLRDLFGDRGVVNFQGTATLDVLSLEEMTWLDPLVGVVPGNEKADPGNAIRLSAGRL